MDLALVAELMSNLFRWAAAAVPGCDPFLIGVLVGVSTHDVAVVISGW